jgi:hypothetical protein
MQMALWMFTSAIAFSALALFALLGSVVLFRYGLPTMILVLVVGIVGLLLTLSVTPLVKAALRFLGMTF